MRIISKSALNCARTPSFHHGPRAAAAAAAAGQPDGRAIIYNIIQSDRREDRAASQGRRRRLPPLAGLSPERDQSMIAAAASAFVIYQRNYVCSGGVFSPT